MKKRSDVVIDLEEEIISDDDICLLSDEHLAIHIMHRFNIDCDTLTCMPAFQTPLQSILPSEKKQ